VAVLTEPFFSRVVVPVADRDDAAATAATLRSYLAGDSRVIAFNVLEKAGGPPDKTYLVQREQRAVEVFSMVTEGFADSGVVVESELRYGTDIASSIVDAAHDRSASGIVFTPRGGRRWRTLLTGDVTHNLVRRSDVPIVFLPDREERIVKPTSMPSTKR
jgi:nucleotide-binding universal stress UspA family protein